MGPCITTSAAMNCWLARLGMSLSFPPIAVNSLEREFPHTLGGGRRMMSILVMGRLFTQGAALVWDESCEQKPRGQFIVLLYSFSGWRLNPHVWRWES